MRRVFVLIGVLAVLALIVVLLFLSSAPDAEPPRRAEAPAVEIASVSAQEDPVSVPRVEPAKPPAAARTRRPAPAPPVALERGTLSCIVHASDGVYPGTQCTLTVLAPAGGVLATEIADRDGAAKFLHLPTNVPLLLRVAMPGYLTGLCCDVVLSDDTTLEKTISLLAAPYVGVRVLRLPDRTVEKHVHAELMSGDDVVASGDADRKSVV